MLITSSWGEQLVVHSSWKWKLHQDRRPSTTTHEPAAFETKRTVSNKHFGTPKSRLDKGSLVLRLAWRILMWVETCHYNSIVNLVMLCWLEINKIIRRTVFSKTVFSIARSTFRMYSVMAIFRSSIVWGLFEYTEFFIASPEEKIGRRKIRRSWKPNGCRNDSVHKHVVEVRHRHLRCRSRIGWTI
jgi:hypothetical protein